MSYNNQYIKIGQHVLLETDRAFQFKIYYCKNDSFSPKDIKGFRIWIPKSMIRKELGAYICKYYFFSDMVERGNNSDLLYFLQDNNLSGADFADGIYAVTEEDIKEINNYLNAEQEQCVLESNINGKFKNKKYKNFEAAAKAIGVEFKKSVFCS